MLCHLLTVHIKISRNALYQSAGSGPGCTGPLPPLICALSLTVHQHACDGAAQALLAFRATVVVRGGWLLAAHKAFVIVMTGCCGVMGLGVSGRSAGVPRVAVQVWL